MLGIIDWGIGGIGIYKLAKQQLGNVPIMYFSDTGATPYGKMKRPELALRLDRVIGFLKEKGVTHLIIGCNAASTAIDDLPDHQIPIEGIIEAAVEMTTKLKPSRLGVIGGRRTVLSGVYQNAFASRGIEIEQRIAQPLSGLIESGDVSSKKLKLEAERILRPLKNCSHILLACTHYPAIENVLNEFVSYKTEFIDPSHAVVNRIRKWKLPSDGNDVFYTSGDPAQMQDSASLAFGVKISKAVKVKL